MFSVGEAEKGAMVEKTRAHGKRNTVKIVVKLLSNNNKNWGKRRQRQEKTKEWSNLIYFLSKLSFLDIY